MDRTKETKVLDEHPKSEVTTGIQARRITLPVFSLRSWKAGNESASAFASADTEGREGWTKPTGLARGCLFPACRVGHPVQNRTNTRMRVLSQVVGQKSERRSEKEKGGSCQPGKTIANLKMDVAPFVRMLRTPYDQIAFASLLFLDHGSLTEHSACHFRSTALEHAGFPQSPDPHPGPGPSVY